MSPSQSERPFCPACDLNVNACTCEFEDSEPDPDEMREMAFTVDEIRYLRGIAFMDNLRKQRGEWIGHRRWVPIAERAYAKLRAGVPEDLEEGS